MTVTIEEIRAAMCDHYCHIPYQNLGERAERFCAACPLNDIPRWIPVTEKLPENAEHPKAFCPRYMVSTKYGVTVGWYNPSKWDEKQNKYVAGWYVLMWFMYDPDRYANTLEESERDISFERGDIHKLAFFPDALGIVKAWMTIPDPYKEGL